MGPEKIVWALLFSSFTNRGLVDMKWNDTKLHKAASSLRLDKKSTETIVMSTTTKL